MAVTLGLAHPYVWSVCAICCASYFAYVVIYRRFFHPLAKIPGPLLPAVTYAFQTYHSGQYYVEIEKLHQQYGSFPVAE